MLSEELEELCRSADRCFSNAAMVSIVEEVRCSDHKIGKRRFRRDGLHVLHDDVKARSGILISASVNKSLVLDHQAENLSCFGRIRLHRLHNLHDIVIVEEKVSYQYLRERNTKTSESHLE